MLAISLRLHASAHKTCFHFANRHKALPFVRGVEVPQTPSSRTIPSRHSRMRLRYQCSHCFLYRAGNFDIARFHPSTPPAPGLVLVIDDFLPDPLAVREHALLGDFRLQGCFPGLRLPTSAHSTVEFSLKSLLSSLQLATNNPTCTSAFQVTTTIDSSWIHCDAPSIWTAVCYLSPHAPESTGLTFFTNTRTGQGIYLRNESSEQERLPTDTWVAKLGVNNKFNRLIIFDSRLFHSATSYFGHDTISARLTWVAFINCEGGCGPHGYS